MDCPKDSGSPTLRFRGLPQGQLNRTLIETNFISLKVLFSFELQLRWLSDHLGILGRGKIREEADIDTRTFEGGGWATYVLSRKPGAFVAQQKENQLSRPRRDST